MNTYIQHLEELLHQKTGLVITDTISVNWTQKYRENRPLMLVHKSGAIVVTLPISDFTRIKEGQISPEEYVDKAYWSYGYHRGDSDPLKNKFFAQLEQDLGIHDQQLIQENMLLWQCETCQLAGYNPSLRDCKKCSVKSCPQSRYEGNQGPLANLPDDRMIFFDSVKRLIVKKFGFCVKGFESSSSVKSTELLLRPNPQPDPPAFGKTFTLVVSDVLADDLLLFPNKGYYPYSKEVRIRTILVKSPYDFQTVRVETAEDFENALRELKVYQYWKRNTSSAVDNTQDPSSNPGGNPSWASQR